MGKGLNKHQKEALSTLRELGGTATTRQIAEKLDRNVNRVSQTLGSLVGCVECLGVQFGETRWRFMENKPTELKGPHFGTAALPDDDW